MLLLRCTLLFFACIAFAACQTHAKKKTAVNDKQPTESMNEEAAKPEPPVPIVERKPAETIPKVVKDVKAAAQKYLDARQEEKINPPDGSNPDAAKIEEVSKHWRRLQKRSSKLLSPNWLKN